MKTALEHSTEQRLTWSLPKIASGGRPRWKEQAVEEKHRKKQRERETEMLPVRLAPNQQNSLARIASCVSSQARAVVRRAYNRKLAALVGFGIELEEARRRRKKRTRRQMK